MKAKELRVKTVNELETELHASLREQFNLRMQKAGSVLKHNHQIKQVRQRISKIKTIITELQRAAK